MQKNKLISISTEQVKNTKELLKLEKELRDCADWLHCDIMDGVFVKRKLMEKKQLKKLAKKAVLPLDFHLMCDFVKDESLLDFFISLKPFNITLHLESFKTPTSLHSAIKKIKDAGIMASLVIKLETDVKFIEDFIKQIDMLLIMSVEIGRSGQEFSKMAEDKIIQAKQILSKHNKKVLLQVDGGITNQNSAKIFDLGADCLVSASFVFNALDRCKAINSLKGNLQAD